jgi:hypothetical protein
MALGLLSRLKNRQTLGEGDAGGAADPGFMAGEPSPGGASPDAGSDPYSAGTDGVNSDPGNAKYEDPTGAGSAKYVDPTGAGSAKYMDPTGGDAGGSGSPLPDAVAGPDSFSASTPNTPLAIPGTFALPGSAGAGQFRSRNFMMNRGMGGDQADYAGKKRRFGSGVPVSGSSASLGIDPEELTRRILNR